MKAKAKIVKKTIVAVCTGLAQAVALGLLPDPYGKWATVVLAAAGGYGVWKAKNAEVAPASGKE